MALTIRTDSAATLDLRTLSWTIPSLAVGDVIVVAATTDDTGTTLAVPSGTGLSFTQRVNISGATRTRVYIWTAVATAGGTNVVVTTAPTGSTGVHTGILVQCPTADGYSLAASPHVASATPTGGSQGSVALTGTSGNLYVVMLGDWNGTTGTITWLASATQDEGVQSSGNSSQYAAHGTLTGASTTVGLSAPVTGTVYTVAAIEVLVTSGPAPDPVALLLETGTGAALLEDATPILTE